MQKLLGFEYVKELYANDDDFASVYGACEKAAFGKLYRLDEYLFRGLGPKRTISYHLWWDVTWLPRF
jgi:hypothetical protein